MVPVNKKTLKQYRALCREVPKLKKDISRLLENLEDLPVVSGKVMKSSDDFPYIEEHITVKISEPVAATEIKKQIRVKEQRLQQAEKEKTRIEQFVAEIGDSTARQIVEMVFIDGKRQNDVADIMGYSKGRVSQIISEVLKD